MGSNYSIFAYYYDSLTKNVDYKKRALYFNELIEKFGGKKDGILLDLACGTGSTSEEMARLGYDVIGLDYSQEMLSMALDKKYDSGLNIQYICQDMRNIDMFGTIDITLCVLDSLNHLESLEDVEKVFEKVSLFAEPEGLFIFDVNTLYKHREILADNVYVYETDEVYCVWQNEFQSKTGKVNIDLDFFEKDGENYKRYTESFSEIAFPTAELENLLIKTGFRILAIYSDDTFNNINERTERIIYVARKVK